MEKEYRCAIIGQHPMRFPWGFDEEDTQCRRMKLELAQCIMELRQCGVTEFQVACDPGVGLYAGEIVNITKQNDEAMRLVCVTPFEEQATKWTPQLRERYFDMLADCTDLSCVDYQETPKAQLMAYRRIVKQSDTPALNALKALRGAPISMGRGEIPVGCCQRPSGFAISLMFIF